MPYYPFREVTAPRSEERDACARAGGHIREHRDELEGLGDADPDGADADTENDQRERETDKRRAATTEDGEGTNWENRAHAIDELDDERDEDRETQRY